MRALTDGAPHDRCSGSRSAMPARLRPRSSSARRRRGGEVRVGIIGGGAAGLASAWLLEQEHEVTVFEKDDRFGGHAHTVTIEVDGRSLDVDAGFQFFAPGAAYATFNRLLDI